MPFDAASLDTVLFDLDGTLLDLAYDNYVWRHCVPREWAAVHSRTREEAHAALAPRFRAVEGRLEWYDIDYWSRELGLDVAQLHRREAARIAWIPGARELLDALRRAGKRLVLLTNAHPETLAIKDGVTRVCALFDTCHSSKEFGAPKEDPRFWQGVREVVRFDPARTAFIDDSLPVLRAAHAAGIAQVIAVRHPDSSRAPNEHDEFPSVLRVAELLPALEAR